MMSHQQLEAIAQKLVGEGKIIAAGFLSVDVLFPHVPDPDPERERLRHAYFAGAQQLYARLTGFMETDQAPTERDLKALEQIDTELRSWSNPLRLPPLRALRAR